MKVFNRQLFNRFIFKKGDQSSRDKELEEYLFRMAQTIEETFALMYQKLLNIPEGYTNGNVINSDADGNAEDSGVSANDLVTQIMLADYATIQMLQLYQTIADMTNYVSKSEIGAYLATIDLSLYVTIASLPARADAFAEYAFRAGITPEYTWVYDDGYTYYKLTVPYIANTLVVLRDKLCLHKNDDFFEISPIGGTFRVKDTPGATEVLACNYILKSYTTYEVEAYAGSCDNQLADWATEHPEQPIQPWVTPENGCLVDGAYATIDWSNPPGYENTFSYYLRGYNFGFAIPTTDAIVGVRVYINKFCVSLNDSFESTVKLTVDGAEFPGLNRALSLWGNSLPQVLTEQVYGGVSDIWDVPLTPAIVNASSFGVGIALALNGNGAQPRIDSIRMVLSCRRPLTI